MAMDNNVKVLCHSFTYIAVGTSRINKGSQCFFPTETITDACFKELGQETTVTQSEGKNNEPTVGAFDLQTFA